MTLDEVIEKSNKYNIGVVITDHFDLKSILPGEFIFNLDDYFKEYTPYRNDKLLLGIEMGMRKDCLEENREISNKYDFDFILGSIHLAEYNGEYYDIYTENYYKGRSKKEVYENYLENMLSCVKNYDFIDSLGHIDYISRYARYEDTELYYDEYKEILNEIFKELILKDKALEINTRRLGDKHTHKHLFEIYKNFSKLGGKYVTIGSDSHKDINIGNYFNTALELARESGLRPIYFKNRKPEFMNIKL